MDQEMEQMMILAKSHKGKAVELIITKILNSNVYKFTEFLELDNIKSVSFFLTNSWAMQTLLYKL